MIEKSAERLKYYASVIEDLSIIKVRIVRARPTYPRIQQTQETRKIPRTAQAALLVKARGRAKRGTIAEHDAPILESLDLMALASWCCALRLAFAAATANGLQHLGFQLYVMPGKC